MTDHADGPARGSRLLAAGMLLWALAIAARWPLALSFGDEVGYVGQAKLFLDGRVRPGYADPGTWVFTAEGPRAQYPPLTGLLMTPFVAAAPRLVFLTGVLAALALTWVAGRALAAWGRNPAWGLVVLLHPTVTLLARTAISDLMLAAFTVGAWWALRRDRRVAAAVLLALTVGTKPTGFLLAGAVVVGEALHGWRDLRAGATGARARVVAGVAGLAAGLLLTVAFNLLASGKLWFGYDNRSFQGRPPFWLGYFPKMAPVYARSLLLLPPLLVAGIWPFWRRRDFGPVLVIAGLTAMMCIYFFVDTGRSWAETLVLSPRLILPVVAFLLVGYADLVASAVESRQALARAARPVLVVAPALLALAISTYHRRWQEPAAAALAAASRAVDAHGAHELGMTPDASKIAILRRGRTPWLLARPDAPTPAVVLCTTRSLSYRTGEVPTPCNLPGYEVESEQDGFQILIRAR